MHLEHFTRRHDELSCDLLVTLHGHLSCRSPRVQPTCLERQQPKIVFGAVRHVPNAQLLTHGPCRSQCSVSDARGGKSRGPSGTSVSLPLMVKRTLLTPSTWWSAWRTR